MPSLQRPIPIMDVTWVKVKTNTRGVVTQWGMSMLRPVQAYTR